MQNLFLAVVCSLSLLSNPVLAFASGWSVTGAGTSAINGDYCEYTYNSGYPPTQAGQTWLAMTGYTYYSQDAEEINTYILVMTSNNGTTYNAHEIKGLNGVGEMTDATGYYYGIDGGSLDDYTVIDTVNAGSGPVPTITWDTGLCLGGGEPTASSTTSTTTPEYLGNITFGIAILIFFQTMMFLGLVFKDRGYD